jgi:hypothetical protein
MTDELMAHATSQVESVAHRLRGGWLTCHTLSCWPRWSPPGDMVCAFKRPPTRWIYAAITANGRQSGRGPVPELRYRPESEFVQEGFLVADHYVTD